MSRIVALVVGIAVLAAPAAQSAQRSWAQAEIGYVVAHGLMAKSVATFRPNDPLKQGELADLVAGLARQPTQQAAAPGAPATIAQLDAKLVRAAALAPAAASFSTEVRRVGLAPPTRFGSEVAARLLGLRINHPARRDDLELLPSDPSTRAEAAYSAAHVLRFDGWEVAAVTDAAAQFELPDLTAWQKRVLRTAVRFIGYPYVWGGTSELPEKPAGVPARGGFDCSGFVWRVYKLQAYPGGSALAQTLRGRTTFQMSGEVPRSKRIPFAKLQPADVVFFGSKGPRSRPAQVDHTGIYLGGGWMIHSSRYGVALAPLTGWYRKSFAWARRPLAEAGLVPVQ